MVTGSEMEVRSSRESTKSVAEDADQSPTRRGMVLPFQPLSLAFEHVNYYVNMPAVSNLFSVFHHTFDTNMLGNIMTILYYDIVYIVMFLFLGFSPMWDIVGLWTHSQQSSHRTKFYRASLKSGFPVFHCVGAYALRESPLAKGSPFTTPFCLGIHPYG